MKEREIKRKRDKNDESPAWSLSKREASELDFLFSFSLRYMMRFPLILQGY